MLDMINSWTIKAVENRDSKTIYDYTLSWTEKINKSGLMIVNKKKFLSLLGMWSQLQKQF